MVLPVEGTTLKKTFMSRLSNFHLIHSNVKISVYLYFTEFNIDIKIHVFKLNIEKYRSSLTERLLFVHSQYKKPSYT